MAVASHGRRIHSHHSFLFFAGKAQGPMANSACLGAARAQQRTNRGRELMNMPRVVPACRAHTASLVAESNKGGACKPRRRRSPECTFPFGHEAAAAPPFWRSACHIRYQVSDGGTRMIVLAAGLAGGASALILLGGTGVFFSALPSQVSVEC
jgi:hypothetical protein